VIAMLAVTFSLVTILFGDRYVVDHHTDEATCITEAAQLAADIDQRGWASAAEIYCRPEGKPDGKA